METVTVQINNQKAYKLLEELEAMNLLKVIRKSVQKPKKLSKRFAGVLPTAVAAEMQSFVEEGRESWGKSDT
jgi:hypothetical protein